MKEWVFFIKGRWRCRLVFSLDCVDSTVSPELGLQRQFGASKKSHRLVSSVLNDQSALNMFTSFVRLRFFLNFTLLALSASGIFSSWSGLSDLVCHVNCEELWLVYQQCAGLKLKLLHHILLLQHQAIISVLRPEDTWHQRSYLANLAFRRTTGRAFN